MLVFLYKNVGGISTPKCKYFDTKTQWFEDKKEVF
jgi:hypothetical protein